MSTKPGQLQAATFVLDLATRERGYGVIKSGVYDMKLTPISSPPPPWPENEEYKPALGCWMWNPTFGEVRVETNATLFREAIANVWDKCRFEPQAAEKLQPVICFADRVSKLVKQVGKTFYTPVIKIVGWVERDRVPGWAARTPTVLPPAAPLILPLTLPPVANWNVSVDVPPVRFSKLANAMQFTLPEFPPVMAQTFA